MNKHTFTPGARVRVFPSGEKGTIVDSPELSRQFPQFVPVSFDGAGTSTPCSPDNLIVLKHEPAAVFTPGDRVTDRGNGRPGTVADDPAMHAEYPGMIPVHWDNGWRTCAAPAILAPATGITAVEFLRTHPELTTDQTTVTQLIRAAAAAGLKPSALFKAWRIVTGAKK